MGQKNDKNIEKDRKNEFKTQPYKRYLKVKLALNLLTLLYFYFDRTYSRIDYSWFTYQTVKEFGRL